MNTQLRTIAPGSLADVAQAKQQSLAETFIGADVVIVIDTSGSMNARDARGRQSRYEVALAELAQLQQSLPGKIAVINFSNEALFEPGGQPRYLGDGTNLAKALRLAKHADVAGVRFVVISDGEPDSESEALDVARQFTGRIDGIFVGPEYEHLGQSFLARLAAASGGHSVMAASAEGVAQHVQLLLSSGG